RALLAANDQRRIGTNRPEGRGEPRNEQPEIELAEIDIGSEQVDRPARFRYGKRHHSAGPPKTYARTLDHRPATRPNLDGPTHVVPKVEIENLPLAIAISIAIAGDPDVHGRQRSLELRPR